MSLLCYFYITLLKKCDLFVSLYKELLEPSFSARFIVLDNLFGVFGCSVIIDFISAMFGFSKVFGR